MRDRDNSTPSPSSHVVGSKCQYSEDVGMPEYRCVAKCQYEADIDALVKAERDRCLAIVDEYYGGGRSFLMRRISSPALATATEGSGE